MDPRQTTPSLERLLTSPHGFGLRTATPLQRAICRVIDGAPLGKLATHADVIAGLTTRGIERYEAGLRPQEVTILSAIRCAKSMMCAAAAYRMARTCDLTGVSPHEPPPRVPVLSVYKDNAAATYGHLLGAIRSSELMRATLVCEPTAETITVRHETGRPIEIKIVAGSRAGTTIASRWLAGLIFDEAPRMAGQEHVVNLHDLRLNALGRMLPGARILYPGSPWAPYGTVYDLVQEYREAPGSVFVTWAPGWLMNPYWWTPDRCAEMRERSPAAYRTDVEAKFASPAENLYTEDELLSCAREPGDLPYSERHKYFAAIDPATRSNAWTLVIVTREGQRLEVAAIREWVPRGGPLVPSEVLRDIAELCRTYRVELVWTDQYYADALADIGRQLGVKLVQSELTTDQRVRAYLTLKTRLGERRVTLPRDPALIGDLKRVQKVPTQQGGVRVVLPLTVDGRHCDYAPSLVLACHEWLKDAEPLPPTEDEKQKREAEALRKRVIDRAKRAPKG